MHWISLSQQSSSLRRFPESVSRYHNNIRFNRNDYKILNSAPMLIVIEIQEYVLLQRPRSFSVNAEVHRPRACVGIS